MTTQFPEPSSSSDGVAIVPMRPRHLRGVVAIENSVSARPWSERLFRDELKDPERTVYLVAVDGAVVIGFAGAMLVADEAHVTNVAVMADRRRGGLGRRLVGSVLERCVEAGAISATLEVRASNRAAQRLYHSFGFVPAGVRPAYYRDNAEDALIMWSHDLPERLASIGRDLEQPMSEQVRADV